MTAACKVRAASNTSVGMMEPPEAVYNRGLSLQGARRPDEALACFDQILAAYPHVVEVLSARAIALAELGRYGDALATCERMIAIRPDYVDAHYNQALFLQRLGRTDARHPARFCRGQQQPRFRLGGARAQRRRACAL